MNDFQTLLNTKDELHPDLMPYYTPAEDGGMEMVKHPFCYSVPHSQNMNALVNERYRLIKDHMAKLWDEGKWSRFIFLHERPYRLDAFLQTLEFLTDEEFNELLAEIWVDSENIWQNKTAWENLFKYEAFNKNLFMSDDDLASYKSLPEKFTIYRGTKPNRELGMSWTLDEDKAAWFARRLTRKSEKAIVIQAEMTKEHTLAYLGERNESEIITLPHHPVIEDVRYV